MPQADLYYSEDLNFNAGSLLAEVEATILALDPAAGACKGRAFAVEVSHNRHLLLQLALLEKPHRDATFMTALQAQLAAVLRPHVTGSCALGVELRFLSPYYLTELT